MFREKSVQTIKETTINIVNSEVESIRLKNDTKTSLRIYKDGFIGVAGAIGSYDEAQLTKEAVDALEQRIEYPFDPTGYHSEHLSLKKNIFDSEKLADEVRELLSEMREAHPDFIFSYKIMLQEIFTKMTNDNDLDLSYEDEMIAVGFLFKEKTSTNIMDGFISFTDRRYDRSDVLRLVNNTLSAYRNKVELPEQSKIPVLFPENEFPITKFYSDLNAHLFASGSSLFSGKQGQKVFSDDFTFYLSRNPEDGFNVPFYDAEGTVNEDYRYPLIKNGVIQSPYTDKKTSAKYALPLTGSAGSAYDGVPDLQFAGYKVKDSNKTVKELLNGQMGILVLMASGGDYTPTGEYASPVQVAMLFDGEKLIGRLPEFQISSDVFHMFGEDFRGVGKDMNYTFANSKLGIIDMNISKL